MTTEACLFLYCSLMQVIVGTYVERLVDKIEQVNETRISGLARVGPVRL